MTSPTCNVVCSVDCRSKCVFVVALCTLSVKTVWSTNNNRFSMTMSVGPEECVLFCFIGSNKRDEWVMCKTKNDVNCQVVNHVMFRRCCREGLTWLMLFSYSSLLLFKWLMSQISRGAGPRVGILRINKDIFVNVNKSPPKIKNKDRLQFSWTIRARWPYTCTHWEL